MRHFRTIVMGASALALAGCISIRKPEPFSLPVAAEALKPIAAPEEIAAPVAEPEVAAAPAPATPEPASAPARSDVQGAGDGSMKLDRITITAKDIPHRAPNYSPEQTASFVCLSMQQRGFNADNARRAHEATVKAKELREKLKTGEATLKQSDAAELKRQDAIRDYRMPVPLLGLMIGGSEKKGDLPPPRAGDVVIENPDLFTFKENGKEVMAVSGTIRNTGALAAELPPVTLQSIDEWDFVLAGQTSLLPFAELAPGEARTFELRFHNPPEYTAEVYVHFAPPFSYRNRRDCDFFDPTTFNAERNVDALVQTSAAAPAAKDAPWTAGELNYLTQYYRREAATVWRCRLADRRGCFWAAHALRWRDMFEMSEAIDAAWIALRAADETRVRKEKGEATEADLAKADAARDALQQRVRALGDKALVRAGASAPDVEVTLTSSTYGLDQNGLYVEVTGTAQNKGTAPRQVDALMLAFVDRLELPLSSVAVDFPHLLQPGESAPFSQRIQARENGGLGSFDIELGPGTTAPAMARVPPKDIPWEVRVGAMVK